MTDDNRGNNLHRLTKIGWIVVLWTIQAYCLQVRYGVLTRTLVDAVSLGHNVDVVEHLVRASTGLMYCANYCSAALGQSFQDRYALVRTRTVQTARKHNNGNIFYNKLKPRFVKNICMYISTTVCVECGMFVVWCLYRYKITHILDFKTN